MALISMYHLNHLWYICVIMFRYRILRIVNRMRGFSTQTQSHNDLEKRVTELEHKVKQKEADIETLVGVSGGLFIGIMYLVGTTKR
jgi:DNA repair exonuclease SbcCD ATPase subunit